MVWAVHLSPYNKYAADNHTSNRPKVYSTHQCQAAADQDAKGWWASESWGVDSLEEISGKGEPLTYSLTTCLVTD